MSGLRRSGATLGFVLVLLVASGCATGSSNMRPAGHEFAPRVVDGRTGVALAPEVVLERLAASRVVLVGEQHAEPTSMATHVAVLEAVATLSPPRRVAVAVEWLPASARFSLSGWLSSSEPVSALRVAVEWDRLWGHDFAAYAPVLEAVRRLGVALVPINAEPGLARLVARHGPEGVPEERRPELPPLDSGNEAHRAWFFGLMRKLSAHHPHGPHGGAHGGGHGGHGGAQTGPDSALERLYLAQLVWDETMAKAASELAERFDRVVVLAGSGHVARAFGIPERLARDLTRLVVLPVKTVEDGVGRAVDADFPEREADLFWSP